MSRLKTSDDVAVVVAMSWLKFSDCSGSLNLVCTSLVWFGTKLMLVLMRHLKWRLDCLVVVVEWKLVSLRILWLIRHGMFKKPVTYIPKD